MRAFDPLILQLPICVIFFSCPSYEATHDPIWISYGLDILQVLLVLVVVVAVEVVLVEVVVVVVVALFVMTSTATIMALTHRLWSCCRARCMMPLLKGDALV